MATPQHVPGSFCWFECGTTDVDAAKKFYTGLFDWNTVDVPMPGMEGHYTLLRLGDDDVAGLYQMGGPQFEAGSSCHRWTSPMSGVSRCSWIRSERCWRSSSSALRFSQIAAHGSRPDPKEGTHGDVSH